MNSRDTLKTKKFPTTSLSPTHQDKIAMLSEVTELTMMILQQRPYVSVIKKLPAKTKEMAGRIQYGKTSSIIELSDTAEPSKAIFTKLVEVN